MVPKQAVTIKCHLPTRGDMVDGLPSKTLAHESFCPNVSFAYVNEISPITIRYSATLSPVALQEPPTTPVCSVLYMPGVSSNAVLRHDPSGFRMGRGPHGASINYAQRR
ncbi:hypothetical protein MTO96_035587 [Rhipicephalus appendiculatus]